MSAPASASLADHVVFRELPFCGILLDTRSSSVYRLSQAAAAALRVALEGADEGGPYEPAIAVEAPQADAAATRALLASLAARRLLKTPDDGDER